MPNMNYLTACQFDFGAVKGLGAAMRRLGIARPLLVSDAGLKAAGLIETVLGHIPNGPGAVFDTAPINPSEAACRAAAEVYRAAQCDGLIALGGGSPIDLAKGAGLVLTHEGPLARLGASQRGTRLIGPIPPLIAIPTTAGTGSEVSVGAMVILEDGRKETLISPHLIPSLAICDPELTLGLPSSLTAATGMDALTHCVEAVLSTMIHPPAEAIGLDGLERLFARGWLARAVEDGSDREARWQVMMASYQGALAFVKGLGAVHGLSHGLGRLADLRLHHGTLNAILLPHSLAMLAGHAEEKLARLRKAMEISAGADVAEAIAQLNARIKIPANLGAIGVRAEHLALALDYAVSDLATNSNARKFGPAEYEELFKRAL